MICAVQTLLGASSFRGARLQPGTFVTDDQPGADVSTELFLMAGLLTGDAQSRFPSGSGARSARGHPPPAGSRGLGATRCADQVWIERWTALGLTPRCLGAHVWLQSIWAYVCVGVFRLFRPLCACWNSAREPMCSPQHTCRYASSWLRAGAVS